MVDYWQLPARVPPPTRMSGSGSGGCFATGAGHRVRWQATGGLDWIHEEASTTSRTSTNDLHCECHGLHSEAESARLYRLRFLLGRAARTSATGATVQRCVDSSFRAAPGFRQAGEKNEGG